MSEGIASVKEPAIVVRPILEVEEMTIGSHLAGVVPEFQNREVGRLLKLAQRDDAIAPGIDLMEWTFSPFQLENVLFNLARLGAILRRNIPNYYGRTSSPCMRACLKIGSLPNGGFARIGYNTRSTAKLAVRNPVRGFSYLRT
jgi:hypothetical protein